VVETRFQAVTQGKYRISNERGSSTRPIEVLLVEDSATQAQRLQHLMAGKGYATQVASNGREALDALHGRKPNVVISDVVMPEMDGYALCHAIKADPALADTPVILVTSLIDPQDIVRGLECGADNFVRKPYADDYLLKRVEHVLLNQRMRRESVNRFDPGIAVYLGGQKHFINAERQQVLDLLISTYEQAVCVNEELQAREGQISDLNASLARRAAELEVINEEVRASLKEKEVLLQEIHHRVKNNLQIIASLLSLQSGYIRDPQTLMQFQESQGRIRSMALIHEKLYQSATLAAVDLADYIRTLVSILMRTYTSNANVTMEFRLEPANVSIDTAVPVGLMLNELVTNALKYAFPNGRPGQLLVAVEAAADGQLTLLRVEDDGVGLKPDFHLEQANTLGLRLVRMFAKQLRADVTLRCEPGRTAFDIRFKEAAATSP